MRVLLLDNYDSFTFNLVQALAALGAEPVVHRNDALDVGGALALAPDAIVVSPGPCTPAEAGISTDLVRAAAGRSLPLLGVCLGHQAMAVAFGGGVVRAPRLLHGKTSAVHHDGRGVFAGLPSPFEAMRYHSLTVAEPLPDDLELSASTRPGGGLAPEPMAMRHRTLPLVGVQFHPESYRTPEGPRLLDNFLALARRGVLTP